MRIRTVKPEWLDDDKMSYASAEARVASISLILLADDYGRGRADQQKLGFRIFPGSPEKIHEALATLSRLGFLRFYTVREQRYFEIINWPKHQKVDKPGKTRVPHPSEASENILVNPEKPRETLATDLDPDLDLDQDRDPARARARDSHTELDKLTLEVSSAYRKRYIAARPELGDWQKQARNHTHFRDVAIAARDTVDGFEVAVQKALDAFFEDSWAKGKDWPPSALASGFGKYYAPPEPELSPEDAGEAERAARNQRAREREAEALKAKFERDRQLACKPPQNLAEILPDALKGIIGRQS